MSKENSKIATLLECLRLLPEGLVPRDFAAMRDKDMAVAEHLAQIHRDEDGYEVRRESRNYGRTEAVAVGFIGGSAVYRQL